MTKNKICGYGSVIVRSDIDRHTRSLPDGNLPDMTAAHHALLAVQPADPLTTSGQASLMARLASDPVTAAVAMLGCELRSGEVTVRITEVEAYAGVGEDPASHAYRGRTARNAVMFGPPGQAYVYFVFGMHWCLNVVCGQQGSAAAVLLRAGEVTSGVEVARRRRGVRCSDRDLARGPARLAAALGIDGSANGTFLLAGGTITLVPAGSGVARPSIQAGPRVGVAAAVDTPWRFWLSDEPTVSAYRRHTPRRPAASHPS